MSPCLKNPCFFSFHNFSSFVFFLNFLCCFLFFLFRDLFGSFLLLIFCFAFFIFLTITNRPLLLFTTQFSQNSKVLTNIAAADFAWSNACNSFGLVISRSKSFILQAPDLWKSIHFFLFFIFLHCSFTLTWYSIHITLIRVGRFFSLFVKVLRTLDIRFWTCVKFAYVSCTKDIWERKKKKCSL